MAVSANFATIQNDGAVFVYTSTAGGWTLDVTLSDTNGGYNYRFGESIALSHSGDTLVVGGHAPAGVGDPERVFIFERDGGVWSESAMFEKPGDIVGDTTWFGVEVDITADGSRIIVGVPYHTSTQTQAGAAVIYRNDGPGWVYEQTIISTIPANDERLGTGCAINGDGTTIAVGAPFNDSAGSNQGRVVFFTRSGNVWSEFQSFTPTLNTTTNALVGRTVKFDDTNGLCFVSAVGEDVVHAQAGAVLVLELDGIWGEIQTIVPPSGDTTLIQFGLHMSVSPDGVNLMVGSKMNVAGFTGSGQAYVYRGGTSNWELKDTLTPPGQWNLDAFICAISNSGNTTAVIGAEGYSDAPNYGAAYVYTPA
jgi:hypothetical protein